MSSKILNEDEPPKKKQRTNKKAKKIKEKEIIFIDLTKDDDDEKISSDWENLPDIALGCVFYELPEIDRYKTQFVCKRWYNIMRKTPYLWRRKRFRFSGRDPHDLTPKRYKIASEYIKIFGKYLREFEMQLYSPISSDVCTKFKTSFNVCVNNFIKLKTPLEKLSLPYLYIERSQWTRSKDALIAALSRLFCRGQPTLRKINLEYARMTFDDAYKVLFSLAYNEGSSIQELDIEDFIVDRKPVHERQQLPECMKHFCNLIEIHLNYSYLSDDFITTMATSIRTDSLKRMFIHVSWKDPDVHGVYDKSWHQLVTKCPNMMIYTYFLRVLSYDAHLKVLRPEMPVRQIVFDGSYFYDHDWHICPTLNTILPCYENTLRRLTLDLPDTMERFEPDLLKVMLKCKNLYYLKITAFLTTKIVEKLLVMVEEGKSALDTLKIKMLVPDFDTSTKASDLERIYNTHRSIIKEKFYEYEVFCETSI